MSYKSGSPPQVRGKPKRLMVDSFGDRITPAGAGKTSAFIVELELPLGSPPQVRGKQLVARGGLDRVRITPAGAGKT